MIHIIKTLDDPHLKYLDGDPIYPHIPKEEKITSNRFAFLLKENDIVKAVTCVAFSKNIPTFIDELDNCLDNTVNAVFYSIWSNVAGAGGELLLKSVSHIREHMDNVDKVFTLSPKTKIAERFHLKNGAKIYRINEKTINFYYEK